MLLDNEVKQRILKAINDHSELRTTDMLTHIVQDADMLDGLGAIGIMRAYTSKAFLPAYEPNNPAPTIGRRNTTIHEQIAFQLEWVDLIHTKTGRALALKRGLFMRQFLAEFKLESQLEDING